MTHTHTPTSILVIDDNIDDQLLTSRALRQAFPGAQVDVIGDPDTLQRALQDSTHDVVVTDYQLGFTDGITVLKHLKSHAPQRPVIMFTFTGNEEIAVQALKAGADDYVLKSPERLPLLVGAVTRAAARAAERRRAAQAEQRHRALFDRVPVGLFLAAADGTLIDANPALSQLLGLPSPAGLVGLNTDQIRENFLTDPLALGNWLARIEHGEDTLSKQLHLRTSDAREIWVEVTIRVTRTPEGGIGVIEGSVQDVTQRVTDARELQALNETLERRVGERTRQLQDANERLEAFAYSVSHDLRAPLRHVEGFTGLLARALDAGDTDRAKQSLARIQQATTHMNELISGLLAFARTTEISDFQPVDLSALLTDARHALNDETEDREVHWDITPLPTVRGDTVALRQVLINLLSNALKFTRTTPHPTIRIWTEDTPHEHTIHVQDNGVGFDPRYRDRLFNVLQRLHPADQFEGIGIGLASTQQIIQRHGGRIWAESQPDQGATFSFTLPK